MKNIELYRTIEALVDAKKQQCSPGKPSFAHEYCKQQIQKKKLIPFNPKSKMNRIMKNFHQLDTYVNVEQLFQYINMLVAERQKQDIKSHTHIKWRSKQNIVINDYQIIDRVREKLGPYNHKIFLKENQELWNLISELESKSNAGSYRKQNSPNNNDLIFFTQNTKEKQQDKKFASQKQQWRFYEGNNYVFEDQTEKRQIKTPQIQKLMMEKPSLKKRQQRRQLIHQVATYLQIILENHHKKKWGKRKTSFDQKQNVTISVQPNEQKEKQKEKLKTSFKIHRMHSINTQHKSVCDKTINFSEKNSPNNSFVGLKKQSSTKVYNKTAATSTNCSFISKKVGVKQNFTFRNRNIKQGLMKKLDSFLEFVENQQKQFKKQKNNSINELIYLQNKEKNNYRFYDRYLVVDDHEIKAVQNIVRSQK